MKKLLATALILGAGVVAVPSIEARTSAGTAVSKPQIRIQIGRNRRYSRYGTRSYVTTRVVRDGWRTYRETVRTTYYPNGTARTQVISRDRIR